MSSPKWFLQPASASAAMAPTASAIDVGRIPSFTFTPGSGFAFYQRHRGSPRMGSLRRVDFPEDTPPHVGDTSTHAHGPSSGGHEPPELHRARRLHVRNCVALRGLQTVRAEEIREHRRSGGAD